MRNGREKNHRIEDLHNYVKVRSHIVDIRGLRGIRYQDERAEHSYVNV